MCPRGTTGQSVRPLGQRRIGDVSREELSDLVHKSDAAAGLREEAKDPHAEIPRELEEVKKSAEEPAESSDVEHELPSAVEN
jgi:hypothetical protein